MNPLRWSFRAQCFLGFAICAGLLGYALYVQFVQQLEPCPFCIFQRLAFAATGVFFLLGALHGPRRPGGRKGYGVLAFLGAATGIGIAGRHVWVQLYPPLMPSCGPGWDYMIETNTWLGVVQKVLQNLLDEGVHIRDMRTIVETLAESAGRSQDSEVLTAQVRVALGRSIVQQLYPSGNEMQVMSLDPQLERILQQAISGGGDGASIEPGLADTLMRETAGAAQRQEELGLPAVLLVPGNLRVLLSRFLRRSIPQLKVLAHGEVPEHKTIRVTSIIGGRS